MGSQTVIDPRQFAELPGGFVVPRNDSHIAQWQIQSQRLDYDEYLLPKILPFIREGDEVLDCGAFNGDHAIAYARKVGKSGRVIAVEAGPIAFDCLCHNAMILWKTEALRILPVCNAIWSMSGENLEWVQSENLGASRIQDAHRSIVSEAVRAASIDTICDAFECAPSFIKIDVEGCELQALLGATKTITKHRPSMLIEINRGALSLMSSSPEELFDCIKSLGYRHFTTFGTENIDDPWRDSPQFDLLCL